MTEPGHERIAAAEQARDLAERRATDARNDARQLAAQNAKLQETLRQARDRLATFRQQLEAMSQPPLTFATIVGPVVEDAVDVVVGSRRLRVALDPSVQAASLAPGSRVLLNESSVLVGAAPRTDVGDIAVIREILPDGHRVIVEGQGGTEQVLALVPALVREQVKSGDSVLVERAGGIAFARVRREDVEDLVLEEIPELDYSQIGGLARQIEQVRDAVELPFLHRELYSRYGLQAPKGILLYGPPGCGKTMIAKAVAHSLATSLAEQSGGRARSFFLNIKGPELLNKYVGETERQIRTIFQRARERASAGMPVIVFFDEMESLFRTRGSGVSSDVESTIVPQLLSEIDGVEGLANVIIIGASNREDLIDPAILRPGRLDMKIKLDRPDAAAAREIFAKYLTPELPLLDSEVAAHGGDRAESARAMIDAAVASLYATSPQNRFIEVTYAGGDREVMFFKDFASGAMISNIVARAKKLAIKTELDGGPAGVSTVQLQQACRDEFVQNEDLPNTTDPDDWARISGKKGERIVFIRTLIGDGTGRAPETGGDAGVRP